MGVFALRFVDFGIKLIKLFLLWQRRFFFAYRASEQVQSRLDSSSERELLIKSKLVDWPLKKRRKKKKASMAKTRTPVLRRRAVGENPPHSSSFFTSAYSPWLFYKETEKQSGRGPDLVSKLWHNNFTVGTASPVEPAGGPTEASLCSFSVVMYSMFCTALELLSCTSHLQWGIEKAHWST